MKIYDMVEGRWITEGKKTNDKGGEESKKPRLHPRLITHEEDKANRSRRSSNS